MSTTPHNQDPFAGRHFPRHAPLYQFRRGSEAETRDYVGLVGEWTLDTDTGALRCHDGKTPGGHPWFGGYVNGMTTMVDAVRCTMTPAPGEIIYVPEAGAAYFGDGETVGGLPVVRAETDVDRAGQIMESIVTGSGLSPQR